MSDTEEKELPSIEEIDAEIKNQQEKYNKYLEKANKCILKINELKLQRQSILKGQENKEVEERIEKYKHGNEKEKRKIYTEALQKLYEKISGHNDFKHSSGTKWDTFKFRTGCMGESFKIEKYTGNTYHTGKHPKANIITMSINDFLNNTSGFHTPIKFIKF
jgi:hypothetical protein